MEFIVNGIRVFYDSELNGGGTGFGMLFIPIIRRLVGYVNNCLEVFSGPSFIGFSLLAYGLCSKLVVADINPRAIDNVRRTIKENRLENKVEYYVSDVLDGLSKTERFDLVVGNPPHFSEATIKVFCNKCKCCDRDIELLKALDKGWNLHRKFYKAVSDYLNIGGNVMFVENSEGSKPEDFIPMINNSGLKYEGVIWPNNNDIVTAFTISLKAFLLSQKSIVKRGIAYSLHPTIADMFLGIGMRVSKKAKEFLKDYYKFYIIWSKK
ncbi:methyltransferase [Saccharolobus islandicus]|uniref:methyltransferase n=1 Tax=Saccharolobus islandicus TaxID=43080 RepID=UPI00036D9765|nr:methyltransferase [Sulfolobus islandicus]